MVYSINNMSEFFLILVKSGLLDPTLGIKL